MQLKKRYKMKGEQGLISQEGIRLIKELLFGKHITTGDWKTANPNNTRNYLPALPHDFQWKWQVLEGDYKGNITKRVRNYFKKEHGIKVPTSVIEQIGNIARSHTENERSIISILLTDLNGALAILATQAVAFGGQIRKQKTSCEITVY